MPFATFSYHLTSWLCLWLSAVHIRSLAKAELDEEYQGKMRQAEQEATKARQQALARQHGKVLQAEQKAEQAHQQALERHVDSCSAWRIFPWYSSTSSALARERGSP